MVTSTLGMAPETSMKALLEAGVHFGHQTKRWNPKMKPYIFTDRNGIHILDLNQTVKLLDEAHEFISDLTARGGRVLFVGTKKQAQEVVAREAERSGQFYINRRWLGGTLTNFVTIRGRLRTMKDLQRQSERGEFSYLPKKEAARKMQRARAAGAHPRRDARPQSTARRHLRDRSQARAPGDDEAQAPAHPDHRDGRHQLRSGRDRLRDSGQ